MPDFLYKALDKKGNEQQGIVTAESYQEAVKVVKAKDLYPTDVVQKAKVSFINERLNIKSTIFHRVFQSRIGAKQIVPFVGDLAVLIDAGLPLTRALDVMGKQAMSHNLRAVVNNLQADVESGHNFSEALGRYPQYFSDLFVNMVKAGEVGGILGEALERLAMIYEKSSRLETRMRAALMYPMFVLLFALLVVVFIVAFVVPKFFTIFGDMGSGIPLPTMLLYKISNFLQNYWGLLIGIVVGVFIGIKLIASIPSVKYFLDHLKLKLPVFGIILRKVSISRFCRTFGTLLASGVPILQTLNVSKNAAGNLVFEQAIERVKESVKEGDSVAAQLSACPFFPPLVTNMVMVGEETGSLSLMLVKISDRFDDDVDTLVSQLTSLIEPFLIVGLGIIVGFIVVALFLPLVSVVSNLAGV